MRRLAPLAPLAPLALLLAILPGCVALDNLLPPQDPLSIGVRVPGMDTRPATPARLSDAELMSRIRASSALAAGKIYMRALSDPAFVALADSAGCTEQLNSLATAWRAAIGSQTEIDWARVSADAAVREAGQQLHHCLAQRGPRPASAQVDEDDISYPEIRILPGAPAIETIVPSRPRYWLGLDADSLRVRLCATVAEAGVERTYCRQDDDLAWRAAVRVIPGSQLI